MQYRSGVFYNFNFLFYMFLQVKWQGNDLDDNLNFYSCSADGKVCMWALVKVCINI